MLVSYHVHSNNSDGTNTILELVEAAIDLGLDETGVSDHFVYPVPGRPVEWSMALDRLDSYFNQLEQAREIAGGRIRLRFGLECDYEPQTAGALASVLKEYTLDYVIGSMHFLDGFPVDAHAEDWEGLTQPERNDVMRRYWLRMAELAGSGLFDFVGHIDICKKFGYKPTVDLSREIDAALDAIAESGMAVEVNTSGLYMPVGEAYPSRAILRQCRKKGIPVLVTSDAHSAASLTRGFEEAQRLISAARYTETAAFSERKMRLLPDRQ